MTTDISVPAPRREPWNKGRLIGQKRPLKPKDVWTIRVRLQMERRRRDLAMFNLAIDSKLRGCDLVRLRVDDVCAAGRVRDRATVTQKKTGRPVQFEITEQTRTAIAEWLAAVGSRSGDICSRAGSGSDRIFRRSSTLVSFTAGSIEPVSTVRLTGRTRCGERSRPKFTRRPATFGPPTRSSKAPFAISGSRWMTPSRSRSKSSYRPTRRRGPGPAQGRDPFLGGSLSTSEAVTALVPPG